jgi:23S rRNA G2069 N7-methylase RlmK/C1962 C5-methylase RlmI
MMLTRVDVLEQAWKVRLLAGVLERIHESALRLFYGPGEVHPSDPFSSWAIDGYGEYLWITEWEGPSQAHSIDELRRASQTFYSSQGYRGAVLLKRPRNSVPEKPQVLWGATPPESFTVLEGAREHELKFEIRLTEGRHPGLFLDHFPLRQWLMKSGKASGKRVLNTFAYTGSLSMAAWKGGAAEVVTLDLSKPTIQWAERNAALNALAPEKSRFLAGDFFEEVPRIARRGERFDLVISDPPSFSRGRKGTFSTQKDLVDLHEKLFSVLSPGGVLVSSINSANVPWDKYENEVKLAARNAGRRLTLLQRIEQPESFPAHPANPKSRYLKGFIFES